MDEQLKLPAILLRRYDIFPSFWVTMRNLFESLVIEGVCRSGITRSQKEEKVTADHEAQDVSVLEFQRAI